MNPCELCVSPGGELLWQDGRCRIVRVGGAEGDAFPGFCRIIWQAHVREMSDLSPIDRTHLRDVLDAVESVVRRVMNPDKVNLASLGNVVPHLHWHVIPRWTDDSHFPAPIWATPCRAVPPRAVPASDVLASALGAILGDSR
ncbi:MAG: HIT family protein [Rhodocyclaceae bacterium]|nr:HIT family protein [Rhodocyclaceae bacterium]MDZ4216111.1 HIT family protein [Rhodocyclaceae bacterium]